MEIKILEYLTIIFGVYMAWNIGANDVANAISTSVGSRALTLKKAVFIAAIFEFLGAYFLGGNVSKTIQSGIVNPEVFSKDIYVFVFGMLAALLATGLWLNLASLLKLPVSTTHAIVGAVLGFGAIIGGFHAVHWKFLTLIFFSWIITPVFSGIISFLVFSLLQKKILFAFSPIEATKKYIPLLVFFSLFIFSLSIISGKVTTLHLNFSFELALLISFLIGLFAFTIATFLVRKIKITSCQVVYHHPSQLFSLQRAKKHIQRTYLSSRGEVKAKTKKMLTDVNELIDKYKTQSTVHEENSDYVRLEKAFGFLQIISVCLIAFAHGSNDVANAIGPVAAILQTLINKQIEFAAVIPYWILLLGGIGILTGLITWGWRVVETIGHKITTLTPTRGFSAEISTAITILLASKLAIPISTTHALVGAVLGVGLAKGLSALNLKILKDVFLSWIITIPICAILSIIIFYILKIIF